MIIQKIKALKNNLKSTFIYKQERKVQESDKSLNPTQKATPRLQEEKGGNENYLFMMDLLLGWPGARVRKTVNTSFLWVKKEKSEYGI
ncbi:hypothetical protein [Rufibacter hautae]|uniref:Uncharacterized protein n=1 Tax=Rufibacter hautae TaxID=2595005 RepID=A0A5B6TDF3_9BACT|nr:hypothetical protein [Rufibacter hautae]KAA3437143.1 hypothetical protein FOA19_22525 [Rufibacter hautae]